ncbi:hypothetical protein VI817_010540 [Penicillium citrinum]|nr:hypothetical protein VI817_010540 [Penicillium citrinum]
MKCQFEVELIYAIFAAMAVAIPHGGSQKYSTETLFFVTVLTNNVDPGAVLQLVHVDAVHDIRDEAYEALERDG